MMSRLRSAVVLSVATVALTACTGGGDGDTDPTDPTPETSESASAEPVEGTTLESEGFSVVAPEGWAEKKNSGALLLVLSDQVVDDFTTNVNVVDDPTIAQAEPDQLDDLLDTAVNAQDSKDVKPLGEYEVDGEQGSRITYLVTVNSIDVQTDQIAVAHEDKGYVITFSFAPSTKQADRDATIKEVLDTWTWTD